VTVVVLSGAEVVVRRWWYVVVRGGGTWWITSLDLPSRPRCLAPLRSGACSEGDSAVWASVYRGSRSSTCSPLLRWGRFGAIVLHGYSVHHVRLVHMGRKT
jgi:hypothetical protein